MRAAVALGVALALRIVGQASAQDMGWSTITPSITGVDPLGQVLREQREQQRTGAAAPARPDPQAESTFYTPSKARRAANLQQFVDRTRAVDPAGAEGLAKTFAAGDIIEKIGAAVAPQGLRIDNLADAYAVYWINAWQATQGRNDTPSRATIAAVRVQAERALAKAPAFASGGDAMKQQLAETLWIQSALIDGSVEQAKGKPAVMAELGKAVAQGARGMGLELGAMTLTPNGFEPLRR
ncbi:DUF6683 family protein [Caulobacter sp. LARHSG274]